MVCCFNKIMKLDFNYGVNIFYNSNAPQNVTQNDQEINDTDEDK